MLDPQVKKLLEQIEASGAPRMETLSPEQARIAFQDMNQTVEKQEPVGEVKNRTVPGPNGNIPIRVYIPENTGPFPGLIFFHGGGWVTGDLDTHDNMCRAFTNLAECVVISVDYRLAPEHKFPTAVEDCYKTAQWVYEHPSEFNVSPSHLAVGGDSAGGNLAAVVSCLAKKRGTLKLVCQMLLYPATDFSFDTISYRENAEGYGLTKDNMKYFRYHYLRTLEDSKDPLASPNLIRELKNLPPAVIITAEYDPLRDEGEAYANQLKDAGVPVILQRYDGMIHGFIGMAEQLDQGQKALEQAANLLRSAFNDQFV
ncbi:alpha/beta hydrolase [Salibacterium sp. K-3]